MTSIAPLPFTLITGASSGIGRETAVRLSTTSRMLLAGRNLEELDRTRDECVNPKSHEMWQIDLSVPSEVAASLSARIRQTGNVIQNFVYCAGMIAIFPLRLTPLDTAVELMNVNYFSALEITRVLASQRANQDALQAIVFVSSIASQFGAKGHTAYSASKGALDALMKTLAVELAPRVRVNSVLPGAIPTPMTQSVFSNKELTDRMERQYPLGLGTPRDVAAAIEFLVSDGSRWMTGQQLVVDGGRTTNITG